MKNKLCFVLYLIIILNVYFVSAESGVGIRSYQESILLRENQEGCVSVGAYNPFNEDTKVIVGISDELKEVLILQEAESKLLPAFTSSNDAIPLKFCFKVPKFYQRDCSIGSFICELTCNEPQKEYSGEISLTTQPSSTDIGGAGGSATKLSVSTKLNVRVECIPHPREYTAVYVSLALISVFVVGFVLFKRYRKPKVQRDREKLMKLKAEIAKEESKGKGKSKKR